MTRVTAAGRPRISLIQFPGSNCDMDVVDTLRRHFNVTPQLVWHTETSLPATDAVILPGGFSYGDYLRSGALASHSPIMGAVNAFVGKGGPAMGICNGFQILTESKLLPGALLRNLSRQFICKHVNMVSAPGPSTYQRTLTGRVVKMPIAHGEGRYFIGADGLKRLQDNGQIALRYSDTRGHLSDATNPNGATDHIAGIVSENGRVLGMMPHPERATDGELGDDFVAARDTKNTGSKDGLAIFEAFFASFM
jgi:phosphoribosylformylglycinamidine synthase I